MTRAGERRGKTRVSTRFLPCRRHALPPAVAASIRDNLRGARDRFAAGAAEPALCRLIAVLLELRSAHRRGRRWCRGDCCRGFTLDGRLAHVDSDLRAALLALDRGDAEP